MSCCMLLFLVHIAIPVAGVSGWPYGTYGIPMPKTGCPSVNNFEWKTGSRTQKTEKGSHASEDIHLAGIYSDKTDRITQSFCMKTSSVQDGDYTFGKGQYCLYKSKTGSCPTGFREGWLYWDDAAPWFADTIQNLSGTTPDGDYDRNTKIRFCCRNDGSPNRAIELPTSSPFHLLKWGNQCQKVKNTKVQEEWVYWADESKLNMNTQDGLYPKVRRNNRYTKLYYCYYTASDNKTMQTVMVVVYIAAGIAGGIMVILVLICIAQRCFSKKNKDYYEEHNMVSIQCETMMTSVGRESSDITEPTVSYRPSGQRNSHHPYDKVYPPSSFPSGHSGLNSSANGVRATAGATAGFSARPSADAEGIGADSGGDEHTPMLGAIGVAVPRPPSYKERASGIHTPSEAGSPVHEPIAQGITMAGLRPVSHPPTYEEVLREDQVHLAPYSAVPPTVNDDHFDARMSDSDA